jgi:hypothetical protein
MMCSQSKGIGSAEMSASAFGRSRTIPARRRRLSRRLQRANPHRSVSKIGGIRIEGANQTAGPKIAKLEVRMVLAVNRSLAKGDSFAIRGKRPPPHGKTIARKCACRSVG